MGSEMSGRPTPNACRAAFRAWFWGIPFWFDLRFQGFDVLPDPVGFALIVLGAQGLARFHQLMPRIQLLALGLAVFSVLDVYTDPRVGPVGIPDAPIGLLVGLVMAAATALLAWWMCQVVADFARRLHAWDTIRSAETRRLVFVGWQAAIGVTILLGASAPGDFTFLVLGLFFAGIAVLGLLMELMLQARQFCGGREAEAVPAPEPKPAELAAPA